ncbi:MAG: A/G-specific adenine glycosylase [Pseudomonadota bacterium]
MDAVELNHKDFAQTLLSWYDVHARAMPWRVGPTAKLAGDRPDPYHVWLSEIMLQQTTVASVRAYFEKFVMRWPSVFDLAAADDGQIMAAWAGLGYYARARNLLKCARVVVEDLDGRFPTCEAELLKLPGIGPYTAAAVASIAFDRPATVLDGNVERVMARLHNDHTPLPDVKETLRSYAASKTPQTRPGDYAQAVMDLGATVCTPRSPVCGICPVKGSCAARLAGTAGELPKKKRKPVKPTRFGTVFVAVGFDGSVYVERRPNSGLLGGMLGFPGNIWAEQPRPPIPPFKADWQLLDATARHSFTHFHLELSVMLAKVGQHDGFTPSNEFDPMAMPTVMRKVWDLTQEALNGKS